MGISIGPITHASLPRADKDRASGKHVAHQLYFPQCSIGPRVFTTWISSAHLNMRDAIEIGSADDLCPHITTEIGA